VVDSYEPARSGVSLSAPAQSRGVDKLQYDDTVGQVAVSAYGTVDGLVRSEAAQVRW
jgi:hypothetical protein